MQQKLIAISLATALAGLFAPLANAQSPGDQPSPYYLTIGAGTSTPADRSYAVPHTIFTQSDGNALRVAFGRRFSSFRAELEYAHTRFEYGDVKRNGAVIGRLVGDDKNDALSLNAYYDLYSVGKFSAHVGAGIGQEKIAWDTVNPANGIFARGAEKNSTYRFILGLDYLITPNWVLGMDYRRDTSGDITITDSTGSAVKFEGKDRDSFLVNLTYRF